jgi:dolichol-phosphate mannosyltransferase
MFFELGIVIPTYNEEMNVSLLVEKLYKLFPQVLIVIVDDSPNMLTIRSIEHINQPNFKYFHRQNSLGRGSAVLYGFNYLQDKCKLILEMDADFSHNPEEIQKMIAVFMENNCDMLIASRYHYLSKIINWPLSRKIFSYAANKLARFILRVPIADYTNGFRLYNRNAVQEITNTCGNIGDGFIMLSEIAVTLYYKNYKIVEVPTVFRNRLRGKSNLSTKELFAALLGLIKVHGLRHQLK